MELCVVSISNYGVDKSPPLDTNNSSALSACLINTAYTWPFIPDHLHALFVKISVNWLERHVGRTHTHTHTRDTFFVGALLFVCLLLRLL